jgi:type I restriction enzyme S subunit
MLDFSKVSFITEEDYEQINKRSKVDVGDLLFAMIGTIGNPVVVKEDPMFAIKNVALFKANPNYDMTFLSYYLRTPKIREKFEREAKGTTQRFLGLGYLRTFDIPNVPIKDQLEAVKKLQQFENELRKC